jgi:3,4-dihydroxy 2-butanone 4-phosphate synthase / GTP cyclohydrolase II
MRSSTTNIADAATLFARGEILVVVDDEDRENEGDLIMAACHATAEKLAFFVRHTSGVVCAPMPGAWCDRLGLPLMVERNTESHRTAFTDSVDAVDGVTTGISAADRAHTLRLLVDPATTPQQLARPGHIFPLRARDGGVLVRQGHTEAAVDLCRLAGVAPVGIIAEVVNDDGTMARFDQLVTFAKDHGLAVITIADLVRHRSRTEQLVERVGTTTLPTPWGQFDCSAYRNILDGLEHLVISLGDLTTDPPPLVRVHSECLTGDVFASGRCDCGEQLHASLAAIAAEGRGAVVYLRGHEGRGVGLGHKIRAYGLQDSGLDTVDANTALGLPVDSREYGIGAQILVDQGVRQMRLLTNNPAKYSGLEGFGLTITGRVPVHTRPTDANRGYLRAKQDRLGHLLELPQEA